MPTTVIFTTQRRPFVIRGASPLRGREAVQTFINALRGMQAGTGSTLAENFWILPNDAVKQSSLRDSSPSPGFATWQAAVASGVVGVAINGVVYTTTASGGDISTAAALTTSILASTDYLVANYVSATNCYATIFLFGMVAGDSVVIHGQQFFAVSGAPKAPNQFDISSGGAANLAALVNSHPNLYKVVRCRPAATSVRTYLMGYDPKKKFIPSSATVQAYGAGVSPPTPYAEQGSVCIYSLIPGATSSQNTIATAGGGTGQSINFGGPRFAGYGSGGLTGFTGPFGGVR